MKLHIDFETRSTADLKRVGAHKYAQDPSTGIMCVAWACDDGPVRRWHPLISASNLLHDIDEADLFIAHNAAFERAIWAHVICPRFGWPGIPLEKWRCTMAMAYAMGLPGSLDAASAALGIAVGKDTVGQRLMLAMSKPRAVHKNEAPGIYWREDEASLARLYEYCENDVVVERELERRLLPLSEAEQRLWELDQRINDRGILIDRDLCRKAQRIVADVAAGLDAEMRKVTCHAVGACSNALQLTAFLRRSGVAAESVAKDKVGQLLARDDLPGECRKALELRQQGSLTSVSKFTAFMASAGTDCRARGLLQYHAAATGRWGGRRVQPHNFKRPDAGELVPGILAAIETADHRVIEAIYGPVLPAVSDCLRGAILAAPGHMIFAADLAGIEGRVLPWLSGEHWKLAAYRESDAGRGEDMYKIAYANAFNIDPEDVTKAQRTIGKPIELALGYEGGPGAFQIMAKTYHVDISASYAELTTRFPQEAVQAEENFRRWGSSTGMARRTWIAAEIVKLRWRGANPATVAFWAAMKEAAMMAIRQKALWREGVTTECGRIRFRVSGSFLFMQLPGGRRICLPYPKIEDRLTPWGAEQSALTFMAVDSMSHKWVRTAAYGGMLANYATQGTARDILAHGMLAVERAGYPIVLTVHDEIVSEVPAGHGSLEEFSSLVSQVPSWAEGMPIAAGGFMEERYRK